MISLPRSWVNALTAGNLLCGLWAVFLATGGEVRLACGLVLVAGILDLADGALARWAGVSGPLGPQLDALADLVSFGVAPAVVLHTTLIQHHPLGSWFLVATLPLSGMFRLARFALAERNENHNRGLTITMAGITVVLAQLCSYAGPAAAFFSDGLFILGLLLSISALMLVGIPYPTARALFLALRASGWRLALLLALVPVLVLFPFRSLLLLAMLYVAWPPVCRAARLLAQAKNRIVVALVTR